MDEHLQQCLSNGGEMGELMRSIDWSKTPVGPVSCWPPALQMTVSLLLRNRFPLVLWWGPQFIQFYNDTYRSIQGHKHPQSMGQPASECRPEIWHIIGPMIKAPFSGQPATTSDDLLLVMNRKGFMEETHFKVTYSPVPDETVQPTGVGGVLGMVAEITEQVYGERQLRTLRELGARAAESLTPEQACQTAAATLSENTFDVPFALLYLAEPGGDELYLAASSGFNSRGSANPDRIRIDDPATWELEPVVRQNETVVFASLMEKFGQLPSGHWTESPQSAMALPLTSPGQPYAYGVLIAGLSPHRELNEGYRTFFELAVGQVTTAIRNANAYQEQRKRVLLPDEDGEIGLHLDDRQAFLDAVTTANDPRSAGVLDLDYRIIRPDGFVRWLHVHSRTDFTGDGENCSPLRAAGAMIDITERKQAEEIIFRQAEMLSLSYEAIFAYELDGVIITWNLGAQRLYGYGSEEAIGHISHDLLKTVYPQEFKTIKTSLIQDKTWTGEIQHITKNGRKLIVETRHQLIQDDLGRHIVLEINRDVTKRIQYEEAVQLKQKELTAANEELQAKQEELTAANEELQAKQEELTAANEELQAKQEELTAANEELQAKQEELTALFAKLQAQQKELYTAHQNLQSKTALIRKQAKTIEQARDEAEYRATELDTTISSIAAGVVIYNRSGNIIRINEIASKLLGFTSDDYKLSALERTASLKLLKPDGTPYQNEETPLYRALRGEVISCEELMIARVPEKKLWLSNTLSPIHDMNGVIIGVILVFTDITEQKRRVDDLLASERELLKVTLNSIGEGVVAIDQEARVMFINETAANLIGCSQSDAIGQPSEKVFYVFDDRTSEPIDIRNPRTYRTNTMMLAGDLCEVPIALNCAPIKASDGHIIGTVAVFEDISERLKTQQELSKADKLESLGVLAGGIAHDFNNVLGAILSNVQLAMMKMEKNQDFRKYLANTVESTRKASELTKQLLTFSKGGSPVRKDSSLIELIKDTAEFALRGANTKAEFAIPDSLWTASIDEGQISQVIYNLVINAKQAMPRGGIIRLSAENIVLDGGSLFNPGNYVKITIQDQGIGIPKENLAKIFDPFFTTKKEGNGLGLATSYSIIRHHEGYIDVESQEGMGTAFHVYLPALNGIAASQETRKEVTASGIGFKILLMDDETAILDAVGEMLIQYGYQVETVRDGDAAIEVYQEAARDGEPFDVIILDLTVPGGKGGQEVIAHLRDFDPKIKAIVSSGYANDPIMADYERFGFMGVVSKPYKIDELYEVLQKVVNPAQLSLGLRF